MTIPSPLNDAFDNILEAGRLRAEANRLANRAELYESTAQVQLKQTEASAHVGVRMMGSAVVLAHGGEAEGTMIYLPVKQVGPTIPLMPNPTVSGAASLVPIEYAPALIIQLGEMLAGTVVVPKGRVARFRRNLVINQSGEAAKSVARLITVAVGLNTEIIDGAITSMRGAFDAINEETEDATVIVLGVLRG